VFPKQNVRRTRNDLSAVYVRERTAIKKRDRIVSRAIVRVVLREKPRGNKH